LLLDPLDNVEMSETEEMSRLARGLFTYLYEMPAKLAVTASLQVHPVWWNVV